VSTVPITRVVPVQARRRLLRARGKVEGDAALTLTFKQDEVSDVLSR